MEQPQHVNFETLRDGLSRAVGRFSDTLPGGPESFHGMFEILAWVGVLRDRLRDDHQAVPVGLEGLYYVRNIVLHQGADVVELIIIHTTYGEGTYGEGTYGGERVQGQWPFRDAMPPPRSSTGAREYDDNIAGREIPEVLEEVVASLL